MTDQTMPESPKTQEQQPKSPAEMLQDVTGTLKDSANSVLGEGTVDNLKQTATQVA